MITLNSVSQEEKKALEIKIKKAIVRAMNKKIIEIIDEE